MTAGLVEADDVTTLDAPGGGRFYKITVVTMRGQKLLES